MEILHKGRIDVPTLLFSCPECGTTFKIDTNDDYKFKVYTQYNESNYFVGIDCPVCKKYLRKEIDYKEARRWKK